MAKHRDIENIYRLTPLQEGMLFHSRLEPEAEAYLEQSACTLVGLDADAFAEAWRELFARHAVLRTRLHWEGIEHPVQIVLRRVELPLEVEDWRAAARDQAPDELAAALDAFAAEERRRGVELDRAPPMRLRLLRLDERTYRFVWTYHHVLLDGWSSFLLLREIFTLYEARASGSEPPRLPTPRPFADYVKWLGSRPAWEAEAFWRERLAGFAAPTPLGLEREGPEDPAAPRRREAERTLDRATTEAIDGLARQLGATPSIVVHGAWAVLLGRHAGEPQGGEDVVFGTVVSGRPPELRGAETIVGLLINTVPVRLRPAAGERVGEWLRGVHREQLERGRFDHSPLAEIRRWSEVPADRPLFESLLVYENYPRDPALLAGRGGLEIRDLEAREQTNYPLTLTVLPGERLWLQVVEDGRRFDAVSGRRRLAHLENLLASMTRRADGRLGELSILSRAERRQLVGEWNDTGPPPDPDLDLVTRIAAQAEHRADAVALVDGAFRPLDVEDPDGRVRQLTYGELWRRSGELAARLRARGVGPEERVAVALPPGIELVVTLLAVLRARGVYVPLDLDAPAARRAQVVEDSGARWIVDRATFDALAAEAGSGIEETDIAQENTAPQLAVPQLAAYMLYTSGSTGRPKGVVVECGALDAHLAAARELYDLGAEDRVLQLAAITFDVSADEIWPTLETGATLVFRDAAPPVADTSFFELCARRRLTVLNPPTALWHALAGSYAALPPCVRLVVLGGEEARVDAAARWCEALAGRGGRTVLRNSYGPTEATVYASSQVLMPSPEAPWRGAARLPIGRPLAATVLRVLDRRGRLLPSGVAGELAIGGRRLARGYWRRPARTAASFVPDAWGEAGSRLYRTGDRVRLRGDGAIVFLGRFDHQVQVRGFRVELGEVESVLAGLPGVRRAVVLARRHPVEDEAGGELELVAFVEPAQSPAVAVDVDGDDAARIATLRRTLAERLPSWMLPGAWEVLAALPETVAGKIDRRALAGRRAALRVGATGAAASSGSPLVTAVAEIWAEVLGVDQVAPSADFFALGGHSLLATRVLGRLRERFGVDLPLRRLFAAPTVRALAEAVEEELRLARGGRRRPPLEPGSATADGGGFALSFAQERLYFLDRLEPGRATYNMPAALRLLGAFRAAHWRAALAVVVARHDALRATFTTTPEGARQRLAASPHVGFGGVELGALGPGDRDRVARRLAVDEARRPFDLERGPLLRAVLLRLADDEHVALLTLHHIAGDAVSSAVLVRELGELTTAARQGRVAVLPALPMRYVDYAAWQRRLLSGEVLDAELAWWRSALGGAPTVLDLATDRPRPAERSGRSHRVAVRLAAEPVAALRAVSRKRGATLFMTVAASFAALLRRWGAAEDLLLATPIANRAEAALESLIGFFVNTLVLRARRAGDVPFDKLLEAVRESALDAYAHQDLPFEQVVAALTSARSAGGAPPLTQAMVTLDGSASGGLPGGVVELPGLRLEPLALEVGAAKFDLLLALDDPRPGEPLSGALELDADLYDLATARRMAGHVERLLASAAADPGQRIGALDLLGAGERHQLLVELGGDPRPRPVGGSANLAGRVHAQAVARPDAVALVFEQRDSERGGDVPGVWTYAELARRASAWAARLAALGTRGTVDETAIGLWAERGPERVAALVGLAWGGFTAVPLEPDMPDDRVALLLDDAEVAAVVVDAPRRARLPEGFAGAVLALDDDDHDGDHEDNSALPGAGGPREVRPETRLYLMYTSGSTGRPKGVAATHGGVLARMDADGDLVGPARTGLHQAPIAFDASTLEIWGALVHGARLVVAPAGQPSLAELGRRVVEERIDVLCLTAGMFHAMVDERLDDLLGVRRLLSGGDVLSPPRAARAAEALAAAGGRACNVYGPTEITIFAAVHRVEPGEGRGGVPIGRPAPSTLLRVVGRRGELLPRGAAGELWIGGHGVARGYHRRPSRTAEVFVPDAWGHDGTRLYRTGDRVRRRADGALEFLGRLDTQLKVRGFRVEPGEIEVVLASFPEVAEAVVSVLRDSSDGTRLTAHVLHADGPPEPDAAEALLAFARRRLPEYMVPSALWTVDEMPRTERGKIDRAALERDAWARLADRPSTGRAPRTEVEGVLATIWADVLRVESIGVEEDFFALGGHSLMVARVMSRIESEFGVVLPLRYLFEAPTVDGLARIVEARIVEAQIVEASEPASFADLAPRDDHGPAPLSFAQERLFFLDRFFGGGAARGGEPQLGRAAYNIPSVLHLRGGLRVDALRRALREVAARHASLRTVFQETPQGPRQIVRPQPPGDLGALVDLAALPREVGRAEARRRIEVDAARVFDLERGPLLRAVLLRTALDEHSLLLNVHHIVADGVSSALLVREWAALYRSAVLGGEALPLLPPQRIQYADFAVWQRRALDGDALDEQLAFWRRQLADVAPLELPSDRPRPPRPSYRGACAVRRVDGLAGPLQRLGVAHGATLFMALLTAFERLLESLAGQRDFAVATPISGRSHPALEGLVGFFVNTLALRAGGLGDAAPFAQRLAASRRVLLDAQARQDAPFERVIEAVAPPRDPSRAPLAQVMLSLQDFSEEGGSGGTASDLALPDLEIVPGEPVLAAAKLDLTWTVAVSGDALELTADWATDLFDRTTILRWLGLFERLLRAMVEDPSQRADRVELLGRSECHQMVVEWGVGEPLAGRGEASLHGLVRRRGAEQPEAIAVEQAVLSGDVASRAWTYGELLRRAAVVARRLGALGVGPEDRVAVLMERGLERVAALLGVLEAGAAWVPLEPGEPELRLARILEDAGRGAERPVLLVDAPSVALGRRLAPDGRILAADAPAAASPAEEPGPAAAIHPESAAYVLFTSGSTGRPKGAINTHGAIVHRLRWMQEVFRLRDGRHGDGDVVLQKTPASFDVSVWEFFWPLLAGARLAVAPPDAHRDPAELARTIERHRVSVIHFVPSMLRAFVEAPRSGAASATLRSVIASGEALSPDLARRVLDAWPGARLENLYGPTEAAIDVTRHRCRAGEERTPIGRPAPGCGAWVLDRGGGAVPLGVAGELHLGGVQLARGYLGRPGLTAERFVPDGLTGRSGERLYRTGDRVRALPSGALDYLGRLDFQVKLRGVRIELGEVEAALLEHPRVLEAAAGVERPAAGPGDARLTAWVRLDGELDTQTLHALRTFLALRLPDAMVPSVIASVDAFPTTPSGKLDRAALAEISAAVAGHGEAELEPPRTPAEEGVAAVWREVLGIERLGRASDFFRLGGHSLLAMRAVRRLGDAFGIEVAVRDIFDHPTPAGLAAELTARGAAPSPDDRGGESEAEGAALSFAQERLWFLDHLEPGSKAYNMPYALAWRGALDLGALGAAFARLVGRHEVLRSRYPEVEGQPVVEVVERLPELLRTVDLGALGSPGNGASAAESARLARGEARRPFDLAGGPLLRAVVVRRGGRLHHLLITLHHIVADGLSLAILIRELTELYGAAVEGRAARLPRLPAQVSQVARRQRRELRGEHLDALVAWWRQRLDGAPAWLDLPVDAQRRGAVRVGELARTLPSARVAALRALGQERGATLFMTLLSAFAVLLSRWSGQRDLVLGTPVAHRDRRESEGLIGLFLDTLALRLEATAEASFAELLEGVRESVLGAFAHRDLPFEKLVEAVEPPRDLLRTPVFQVFFNHLPPTEAPVDERLELLRGEAGATKFDLTLYVAEGGEETVLRLVYNAALFSAARMEDFLAQLDELLARVVAEPGRAVGSHALRGLAPSPRLEAPLAIAAPELLTRRFARIAAERPDAVALHDDSPSPGESGRPRLLSYGEAARRVERTAATLRAARAARGAERGGVTAVWTGRRAELPIALLAVLEAGGAFVILDPAAPAARLARTVCAARPAAVLRSRWAAAFPELVDEALGDAARIDLEACWMGEPAMAAPSAPTTLDELAYLAFTSGSTGEPKQVRGAQRPLAHWIDWQAATWEVDGRDRVAMLSGLAHDPLLRDVFLPLAVGGVLVVPPPEVVASADLAPWLVDRRVSVVHLAPSVARLLTVESTAAPAVGQLDALRWLVTSGEQLTAELARRLRGRAPRARIVHGYGTTETPQLVSAWIVDPGVPAPGGLPLAPGAAGSRLLVLTPAGEFAAVGELGEIHVQSPHLALDVATGEFDGTPIYATGDLARRRPDGLVDWVGRRDAQVNVRGVRVELGEIESALEGLAGVRQAAVAAHAPEGGEPVLIAFMVEERAVGNALDRGLLRKSLRDLLPTAMVPAEVVRLEALPRLAGGKIDRPAVARLAASRWAERLAESAPHVAWSTPEEEITATIWAEILRRPMPGPEDDFFALGGHSLLAVQVLARMRRELGVEIPLARLFERPTVAGLASAARDARRTGEAPPPVAAVARTAGEPLPLSFGQERLWFLHRLEPESAAYHLPFAVRLEGELEPEVLRRALEIVVERHEILRSRFAEDEDGGPTQIVDAAGRLELPRVDLRAVVASPNAEHLLRGVLDALAQRPFDLARGPLVRAALVVVGAADHVFALILHHIVTDGWSNMLLASEVATLADALRSGRDPSASLSRPAVQYADYAIWQRRHVDGEPLERLLAWWRGELDGLFDAPPIEWPTDRPRRLGGARRGAALGVDWLVATVEAVGGLARRRGATLFMALLAAFDALALRLAGARGRARDLAVGVPTAQRRQVELEPLIGFFVNTLVVRADLRDLAAPTFGDLLDRVRAACLGAWAHQDVPFERLVDALRPPRDLQRPPLVQTFVQVLAAPLEPPPELAGVVARAMPSEPAAPVVDLHLKAVPSADGLRLTVDYDPRLYDAVTIHRLVAMLRRVLETAEVDGMALADLPLLGRAERAQLLDAWGDGGEAPPWMPRTGPGAASGIARIARRLDEDPDTAVILARGAAGTPTVWTRAMLRTRTARLAARLRRLGVGRETRVGVCMARRPEMVAALLAVQWAGGAYVPLDPSYPPPRLAAMLEDAEVAVILTAGEEPAALAEALTVAALAAVFDVPPPQLDVLDVLDVLDANLLDTEPLDAPVEIHPEQLAHLLFTSGSTGRPKGVAVPHRAVAALIDWASETFDAAALARLFCGTSINFDLSVFELFAPLALGGAVVLGRDALELAEHPWARRVSLLNTVPSVLAEWLDQAPLPASARVVALAGEALPPELVRRLADGPAASGRQVWNLYGPSEDTVYSTAARVWDGQRLALAPGGGSTPIGRVLRGGVERVVDAALRLLPVGAPGELVLGGAGLARGYRGRPAWTAERFVPDPFGGAGRNAGARLYRTGDRVRRLADGRLDFLGRFDGQVQVRGFRVELGEVESALRGVAGVGEAAVVVVETGLVAFWTPAAGPPPEPRAALGAVLPSYFVPSRFVELDALPRTPSGKIDRRALAARDLAATDPEPSRGRGWSSRDTPPRDRFPRDSVERDLATIWSELLGVDQPRLDDDFFALGGHSLLAVRLMSRIERRFGRRPPLAVLFRRPTLGALAEVLRGALISSADGPLVRLQEGDGQGPPLVCVHPAGGAALCYLDLARALGADQAVWALQARGLDGEAPPRGDIAEMAQAYVDALRAARPRGPYRLLGWSFGAWVAWEMAGILVRAGEEVARLVLVDAPIPAEASFPRTEAELVEHALGELVHDAPELRVLFDPAELDPADPEAILAALHGGGHLAADLDPARLRRFFEVWATHLRAASAYRPAPCPVDILFARAAERPADDDPVAGWRALASTVEEIVVPGDHNGVVAAPGVGILAAAIRSGP